MVSTRGNKFAFSSGERVLCYEPDPSKAKVLYDSKVLDVIVRKDERSKKYVEYLIHFQGWNSSWDRCVSEDYVLKDTEENRKLQKDLADKAQLQLGAYLYRRNRKKRTRTLSQKIIESSESGTNSGSSKKSPEREEAEEPEVVEEPEVATSSEEDADEGDGDDEANDSSADTDSSVDETIPIDLSEQMKYYLDEDYNLIHNKRKVVRLPATPTVVEILEGYVKHFGQSQLREPGEPKRRTRGRYKEKKEMDPTKDFEAVSAKLNLCKEVVDGLRIYFDFTLGQLLLYDLEKLQYEEVRRGLRVFTKEHRIPEITIEFGENTSEAEIGQNICQSLSEVHELQSDADHAKSETERKRSLRSHRDTGPFVEPSCSVTVSPNNGTGKITIKNLSSLGHMRFSTRESALSTSSTSSYYAPLYRRVSVNYTSLITNAKISKLVEQNNSWKIAPQSYYDERPQHPATVYGAIHLARLFVKLPNLLYVANLPEKENHPRLLPERKMKALIYHLQLFLTYLEGKKEWFGEKHYVDNRYAEDL